MVAAEDQRELLEVAHDMYQLLICSSHGSGHLGNLMEVIGHSSGLIDGDR